jgi:hypothetical protein
MKMMMIHTRDRETSGFTESRVNIATNTAPKTMIVIRESTTVCEPCINDRERQQFTTR